MPWPSPWSWWWSRSPATFGDTGVYAASALTGLVDVDVITLSSTNLAARGNLDEPVAATAIVVAVLVNTAARGGIAVMIGSPSLRRYAARAFGMVLAAGVIGGAVVLTAR